MLQTLNPKSYDLACIQEPYLNVVGLANASNLKRFWDVIYPTNHHSNPECSQTILLVNKKLSKNNWHIILLDSPNITAIEIHGDFRKVHIYNIYNACDHSRTIWFLERHIVLEEAASRNLPHTNANSNHRVGNAHMIWMGDFNHHHPMWEMTSNSYLFTAVNLDAVGILINLLAEYNLTQALPPGIVTLEASNTKNHTWLNNIFCLAKIEQMFTKCSIE